jgi:hypothetical protein
MTQAVSCESAISGASRCLLVGEVPARTLSFTATSRDQNLRMIHRKRDQRYSPLSSLKETTIWSIKKLTRSKDSCMNILNQHQFLTEYQTKLITHHIILIQLSVSCISFRQFSRQINSWIFRTIALSFGRPWFFPITLVK